MFRKVAFLEISRSPLLTGVAGLQYSVCNATKNELLTKFHKCTLKLRKFPGTRLYWGSLSELLQTVALTSVFKALKVTPIVEFLSSEAGANGFSTE